MYNFLPDYPVCVALLHRHFGKFSVFSIAVYTIYNFLLLVVHFAFYFPVLPFRWCFQSITLRFCNQFVQIPIVHVCYNYCTYSEIYSIGTHNEGDLIRYLGVEGEKTLMFFRAS